MKSLSLTVLDPTLAVARLPAGEGLPWWAAGSSFLSLTRSAEETSVVCEARLVPEDVRSERGFRALRVNGTLAFQETGVLVSLATPLATAGVPVFVVSTFDTDYILVSGPRLGEAVGALRKAGHSVTE
jgi:uncharacterized protein